MPSWDPADRAGPEQQSEQQVEHLAIQQPLLTHNMVGLPPQSPRRDWGKDLKQSDDWVYYWNHLERECDKLEPLFLGHNYWSSTGLGHFSGQKGSAVPVLGRFPHPGLVSQSDAMEAKDAAFVLPRS